MKELLGSQTKANILLYLGLRGGCSGRQIARSIRKNSTEVFKALRQLVKKKIIKKFTSPPFYALNPQYPYYDEVIRMIHKTAQKYPSKIGAYIPRIPLERRVDAKAIYEMLKLRGPGPKTEKLSDILRKRYA